MRNGEKKKHPATIVFYEKRPGKCARKRLKIQYVFLEKACTATTTTILGAAFDFLRLSFSFAHDRTRS